MFGKVLHRHGVALWSVVLLLSYAGLLAAALVGPVAVFAVAAACAVALEAYVAGWARATDDLLDRVGLGRVYRNLARDLSVVLLLVRTVELTRAQVVVVLLVPAAGWAVAIASAVLLRATERLEAQPAVTRNIDLGPGAVPPPAWVARLVRDRIPYLTALLVPGAIASTALDDLTPYVVSGLVAVAAAVPFAAVLVVALVRGRAALRAPVLTALRRWLSTVRPQVVVYFAGPETDVYQVDMWLAPVAALDRPALVVLRNRDTFDALAPTGLPVVCVPNSVHFMNVGFDSVRVALYPANVGANIHMLREPGISHVFVGHGDSDKQASVNPYAKVYDEVWVAGAAGRERYASAAVGVRDSSIVEVGRPQLAGIRAGAVARPADDPFTVLYAPTWEGWVDDPYQTSVVLMGEAIVRGLLELRPAVRVIYKPHPLTGTRSLGAGAASDRVVEMLRAAGARTGPLDGASHLVVTGATPGLFDCFNATDLLVSDISGVVADFVQTQRPYVVANPRGLPEEEFRRRYSTARAAYLLTIDGGELEKVVDVARGDDDPLREARRELRSYLLGPDEPGPIERFRAEVGRLCASRRGGAAVEAGVIPAAANPAEHPAGDGTR